MAVRFENLLWFLQLLCSFCWWCLLSQCVPTGSLQTWVIIEYSVYRTELWGFFKACQSLIPNGPLALSHCWTECCDARPKGNAKGRTEDGNACCSLTALTTYCNMFLFALRMKITHFLYYIKYHNEVLGMSY